MLPAAGGDPVEMPCAKWTAGCWCSGSPTIAPARSVTTPSGRITSRRRVPEYFEVSFGQPTRGGRPPSTTEPLELVYRGQAIRLAGRIDRIDTGRLAGEMVFNVLDYKTGDAVRFSVEAVERGLALQLPLYAMAGVEVIFSDRDCVPWQAGYWYLADNGFRPKQALRMYHAAAGSLEPEEAWEAMRASIGRTVAGLVRGMREGQFPVSSTDIHCTGTCPYATVCRIDQIRSLEKTWQPPIDKIDRPTAAGAGSAGRFRGVVGGGRLRQDLRADRAIPPRLELDQAAAAIGPRLEQLTAITFTERAAREMRDRIRAACTAAPPRPRSRRSIIGSAWSATSTRRESARSIPSAGRCCGRTPSRPASIPASASSISRKPKRSFTS